MKGIIQIGGYERDEHPYHAHATMRIRNLFTKSASSEVASTAAVRADGPHIRVVKHLLDDREFEDMGTLNPSQITDEDNLKGTKLEVTGLPNQMTEESWNVLQGDQDA